MSKPYETAPDEKAVPKSLDGLTRPELLALAHREQTRREASETELRGSYHKLAQEHRALSVHALRVLAGDDSAREPLRVLAEKGNLP